MDGERIGKLAAASLKNPLVLVEEFKRLLAPIPEDDFAILEWWKKFADRDTNEDSAVADYSPEYVEWRNRYNTVKNAVRTILQFGNDQLPWTHLKEWAHENFWEIGWDYSTRAKARTLRFVAAEFHATVLLMQTTQQPAEDTAAKTETDYAGDNTPVTAQQLADATEKTAAAVIWSNYRSPKEWRTQLEEVGASHSPRQWTFLRKKHASEIEGTERNCRITERLAVSWNLSLPEFGN